MRHGRTRLVFAVAGIRFLPLTAAATIRLYPGIGQVKPRSSNASS